MMSFGARDAAEVGRHCSVPLAFHDGEDVVNDWNECRNMVAAAGCDVELFRSTYDALDKNVDGTICKLKLA